MTKRKTSWRKVEEEICGRLKNNSRLIDADKLIQAFEVEEDADKCAWTLYGIKRKIESVMEQSKEGDEG